MVVVNELMLFILLLLLVLAALSVFIFEDLLYVVIIFGGYSTIMSMIWQQLNAPDIAITEAAVGVGVSILMITVVTKVGRRPK
ncbi:MAG: hydrogenase subunit MbhD domain-containing protein [Bacillota bacterium]